MSVVVNDKSVSVQRGRRENTVGDQDIRKKRATREISRAIPNAPLKLACIIFSHRKTVAIWLHDVFEIQRKRVPRTTRSTRMTVRFGLHL